MFDWSLNPYMGCVHRCTFCYVRAFERRAERPVGRPLRHVDPRQGQHRRRPAPRARPAVLGARVRRDRRRHRSLPARRGPIPADPRMPRGARRAREPVQHHHARPDDRPRRRRARRGRAPRERLGHVLDPDARRGRLAHDRAVDRASAPAAPRARGARRSGHQAGVGMAPVLPGISDRPEQLREVVRAAREAGATGVWTNLLFLRPGTREHFLEQLARDWPELLPATAALPKPGLSPGRRDDRRAPPGLRSGAGARRRRPPDPSGSSRPQEPEQLALEV